YNTLNLNFGSTTSDTSTSSNDPDATNRTMLHIAVSTFLCPSDANVPDPTYALANYVENLGPAPANHGQSMTGPTYFLGTSSRAICNGGGTNTNGIVQTTSIAAIIDGTSNTAIWSEYVKGRNSKSQDGLHMVYGLTDAQECSFA